MKTLAIIVAAMLASACGASTTATRLDRLERDNLALRRQNALLREQGSATPTARTPAIARPAPQASAVATPMARAWTRRPHGQYVCLVDGDTFISMADRVRFENKVDDRYGLARERLNSWVSFTLNGQPVAVVRSTAFGAQAQYALAPNETCYVELGGARDYKVTAELFKNRGSYEAPVLVSTRRKHRWEFGLGPDDDELPFVFQRYHFNR